ncbi:CHAP domain-containing protein [Pelagibius sp. 7325]|uniref:CHAP domain-containing protein n=1 Tax=Pelagibius sp. 7325 TaxID=3131994 RepID=UPI0030EC0968
MRRPLVGLILMLLASGCAAPQADAGDNADFASEYSRTEFSKATPFGTSPSGRRALASQQAARQAPGAMDMDPFGEVSSAGLSLLHQAPALPRARPAVVRVSRPLQCVPYARELSGIALRGDAWTWWKKADGLYAKGKTPRPGAVLVLSKTRRLTLGHLAFVAEVVDSRNIVVHQANWLNGGRIHRYTPVRDVSEKNDWSAVRVWYTPGNQMGSRTYAVYGFIYPKSKESPDIRQAAN